MSIELTDESVEETLVARLVVVNPSTAPVPLPQKYRCLFHGAESISYGRHMFWFPITHLGYKRLVSKFQSDFFGKVKVEFKTSGFDDM